VARRWTSGEWGAWVHKFSALIQNTWSEKYWLSTPASLNELEVTRAGGGAKSRVQLHCVLKVQMVAGGAAHHRIKVVKANAPDGVAFVSNSTLYDDADLKSVPPGVTGWAKPFNTVVHEIGHTLGLHHACESITPAAPYCLAGHPDYTEVMGKGNELRARYATPWQNAAASWFNSSGSVRHLKPADFNAYTYRIAPADI
jgi:Metallo-peptidase family M12B Reprolysin-like